MIELNEEAQALVSKAESVYSESSAVVITSAEGMVAAGDELKKIKGLYKKLTDQRLSMTRPIDKSKKEIMSFFKKPLDYLASAESVLKKGMLAYEDQLRAEARKAAEAEEARLRKNAAARVKRAEANGDAELADEIRADVADVIVPVVPVSVPAKVAGVSTREVWKGNVPDLMVLVKAVAEGKAPITLLAVNEAVLGQMARSLKGTMQIPGVRFYSEKSLSSRSA